MKLSIATINTIYDLLSKANSRNYVLIPEMSRELKCQKTELMAFIENNPKLFHCETIWSTKEVSYTEVFMGRKYRSKKTVRNKNLGLGIVSVYLSPVDNFRTAEWLANVKIVNAKYIYVSEQSNYGYIYGYQVLPDAKDSSRREHLWRNTPEKIAELTAMGYLNEGRWYMGGLGDSASGKAPNVITAAQLEELNALGWKTNNYSPLSK